MTRLIHNRVFRHLFVAGGLVLGGGTACGAFAATAAHGAKDEIIVQAPRAVIREVGRTNTGARIELITLTRRVSYADLDLKLHGDVTQLDQRIDETAKEACAQLAHMYPLTDDTSPDCVKEAVSGARKLEQEAIAAASK